IPAALRLKGQLNKGALEKSINEIVRRHQSFRTSFMKLRGRPVAVVSEQQSVSIRVVVLSQLPANEREAETQRLMKEEARRPFDLVQCPLLPAVLLELGDQEHLLLLTMHHIVSDGWSMGVFYRELTRLYSCF